MSSAAALAALLAIFFFVWRKKKINNANEKVYDESKFIFPEKIDPNDMHNDIHSLPSDDTAGSHNDSFSKLKSSDISKNKRAQKKNKIKKLFF